MSREAIPFDAAVQMIPDGDLIHTFVNATPGVLIGADWDRSEILNSFEKHGAELSGPMATKMDHGLCFHDGQEWVFVETKKQDETQP